MRRRDFLARTAMLAGAAGSPVCCPLRPGPRSRQGAGARPLTEPVEHAIDTFVVLMMENRSFDHYSAGTTPPTVKNAG